MLLGPSLDSACRVVSFSNRGRDISASWDHDDRHTCDNVLDGIPMSMCIDDGEVSRVYDERCGSDGVVPRVHEEPRRTQM